MHIWEVLGAKPKKRKADKKKTEWETNLTRLRGKERNLDAKKPVRPVSTDWRREDLAKNCTIFSNRRLRATL